MPISPEVAHHRARRAIAVRNGNKEAADDALRELRSAMAERWVADVVRFAPLLTPEQRSWLARIVLAVDETTPTGDLR